MSPARVAAWLGVLGLALAILYVPLAWPARDIGDGWQVLLGFLAFTLPGVVVTRHQPGNPIGWILIGLGLLSAVYADAERYAVIDYHFHHGTLPPGPAAVWVGTALWPGVFLVLPLVILLFPDGVLPRRWRVVLRAYLIAATVAAVAVMAGTADQMADRPFSVDSTGQLVSNVPSGFTPVAVAGAVTLPAFWVSFVARQVLSWRHATGERRQQLK